MPKPSTITATPSVSQIGIRMGGTYHVTTCAAPRSRQRTCEAAYQLTAIHSLWRVQLPVHRTQPKYKNSAAFYDVDGTLIKINIVHAFAFYASRHASLATSARNTVKTALSIPVF